MSGQTLKVGDRVRVLSLKCRTDPRGPIGKIVALGWVEWSVVSLEHGGTHHVRLTDITRARGQA